MCIIHVIVVTRKTLLAKWEPFPAAKVELEASLAAGAKWEPALTNVDGGSLHGSRSTIMSAEDDRFAFTEDLAYGLKQCTGVCAFICAIWASLRQTVTGTLVFRISI